MMRDKLVNYYRSQSFWLHFIVFVILFLSTYALRHYLFLDDNLILESSHKEIRTVEGLEKGYSGLHVLWSLFNLMNLFKLIYSALFISALVSVFGKIHFKMIFKLALFALFVFVFENLAYTFYYLLFPPEVIKEMNRNVFSLHNLFNGEFLRFLFGQLSLFNVLYLVILAELIKGFSEGNTKLNLIYLLVFTGFIFKILLGYFIF